MKKINLFLLLVLSIFLLESCQVSAQAKKNNSKNNLTSIDFNSSTRGTQRKIHVDAATLSIVVEGVNPSKATYKMTSADWSSMKNEVKKLDLSKISDLKAPTSKNQSDGALASSLEIKVGEKTYQSSVFDNLNAPKELLPLVKKIAEKAKLLK
jgi:hypothetical protein